MPLGLDQGIGALSGARSAGPPDRQAAARPAPTQKQPSARHRALGAARGRTNAYSACSTRSTLVAGRPEDGATDRINWLLQRPTVFQRIDRRRARHRPASENLGAIGWTLSPEHMALLENRQLRDAALPVYPYHNGQFSERAALPEESGTEFLTTSLLPLTAALARRRGAAIPV